MPAASGGVAGASRPGGTRSRREKSKGEVTKEMAFLEGGGNILNFEFNKGADGAGGAPAAGNGAGAPAAGGAEGATAGASAGGTGGADHPVVVVDDDGPEPTEEEKKKAEEERLAREARRRKENLVLQQAAVLQASLAYKGLASRKPSPEPKANLCTWDYVLREMEWLAVDFAQERLWKMAAARHIAAACAKAGQGSLKSMEENHKKREAARAKREKAEAEAAKKAEAEGAAAGAAEAAAVAGAGGAAAAGEGMGPGTPILGGEGMLVYNCPPGAAAAYLAKQEELADKERMQFEADYRDWEAAEEQRRRAEAAVAAAAAAAAEQERARAAAAARAAAEAAAMAGTAGTAGLIVDGDLLLAKKGKRKKGKKGGIPRFPGGIDDEDEDEDDEMPPPPPMHGVPVTGKRSALLGGSVPNKRMRTSAAQSAAARAAARGGLGMGGGTAAGVAAAALDRARRDKSKKKKKFGDYDDDDDDDMSMGGRMVKGMGHRMGMTAEQKRAAEQQAARNKKKGKGGMEVHSPGGSHDKKGGKNRGRVDKGRQKVGGVGQASGAVPWTTTEDHVLCAAVHEFGSNWALVSDVLAASSAIRGVFRRADQCKHRFRLLNQASATQDGAGGQVAEESIMAAMNINKSSARQWLQRSTPVDDETLKVHTDTLVHVISKHKRLKKAQQDRHDAGNDPHRRSTMHPSHGIAPASTNLFDLCDQAVTEQVAAQAAAQPAAGTPAAGTPAAGTPAAGTPVAGTPVAAAVGAPASGMPAPPQPGQQFGGVAQGNVAGGIPASGMGGAAEGAPQQQAVTGLPAGGMSGARSPRMTVQQLQAALQNPKLPPDQRLQLMEQLRQVQQQPQGGAAGGAGGVQQAAVASPGRATTPKGGGRGPVAGGVPAQQGGQQAVDGQQQQQQQQQPAPPGT